MQKIFEPKELKSLYQPDKCSSGGENGQVTIIGGSSLFHGAPLLSLKVASRIVDMVFFTSPEPSVGGVAEQMKSKLFSFIWIPWDEVGVYIEKSDAILIGPGLMRYKRETQNAKRKTNKKSRISYHISRIESYDEEGEKSREITRYFLTKFSHKKWVIDAGSLQVMEAGWIPDNAILTPNEKEFELLFGNKTDGKQVITEGTEKSTEDAELVFSMAKKYDCTIVLKGPENIVCSPYESFIVKGGNPGMTKGGTGDVLAGLTVSLLAKNEPFLAATASSYITKAAADELYKKVGTNYNADDLAEEIPSVLFKLTAGK